MVRTCCRDCDSRLLGLSPPNEKDHCPGKRPGVGCFREPAPTPRSPSSAQPSPALPWMCVLPCASGCLPVPPFFGRKGSVRASCPLRSSGVVSLLEVEVSDALIGVGQKSPFCNMLVLSPYIRACARTRPTDRQTDRQTHTRMCVSVRVCTCVSVSIYIYVCTSIDTHTTHVCM